MRKNSFKGYELDFTRAALKDLKKTSDFEEIKELEDKIAKLKSKQITHSKTKKK